MLEFYVTYTLCLFRKSPVGQLAIMISPSYIYEKLLNVNYTLNAENINSASHLYGSCGSCLDGVMPGAQVIFLNSV